MKLVVRTTWHKVRQRIDTTPAQDDQPIQFALHQVNAELGQQTGALDLLVHLLTAVQRELPVVSADRHLAAVNHGLGLADQVEHAGVVVVVGHKNVIACADIGLVDGLGWIPDVPKEDLALKVGRIVGGKDAIAGFNPLHSGVLVGRLVALEE